MTNLYKGKSVKGYHCSNGGYNIMKFIDGKNTYFGWTPIEEDAKQYVEELKKVGWNDELVPAEFKKKFNENKKNARKNKVKGYSKNTRNDKYTVRKYINGKLVHFGTVPTEEEAIRYVKALEACNYNVEYLPEEFKKYVPTRRTNEPKYYHKTKTGYQVSKKVGKKYCYFGVFPTEELAQQVVKELKKYDWDLEKYKLNNPDNMFSRKSEVQNYLKRNTYKNTTGSLSNPKYDKVENKWDKYADSMTGRYKRMKEEENNPNLF